MSLPAEQVPCVWVVASHRELGNEHGHPQRYTVMDEVGTRTLVNLGLQPVCYPRVPAGRLGLMLDTVDGVLLGGSFTNVHPRHFGEEPIREGMCFDEGRDAVSLPLVRLCIERGVPLIAFCRGAHDINVALGGSLHQSLPALGLGVQHWEEPDESLDEQYREAIAEDGLVEAARWHDERQFARAFQFHPEWEHQQHPRYAKIMGAYVEACWERLRRKEGPQPVEVLPQMAGVLPEAA